MTNYPDKRILPVAAMLRDCLRDEAAQNPKPPTLVGFRTGTTGQPLGGLTQDECCDGAAFVRLVRTYPTWGVPAPATTAMSCAQPFGAVFELSMWRCSPIGDIDEPPVQAAWDELHVDLINDRLMLMATICCFQAQRDQRSLSFGDWSVVETDGGCVGSTVVIDVDLFGVRQ